MNVDNIIDGLFGDDETSQKIHGTLSLIDTLAQIKDSLYAYEGDELISVYKLLAKYDVLGDEKIKQEPEEYQPYLKELKKLYYATKNDVLKQMKDKGNAGDL